MSNLIESATAKTSIPSTVVDLNAFCDAGLALSSQSAAIHLPELNTFVQGSLQSVTWAVKGSRKAVKGAQYDNTIEANYRFLQVTASTHVALTCGRCLNTMQAPLAVDTVLQVFQTEQAADDAAMVEDADNTPDPIVSHRQFDLLAQVQEELLLNIPDNPCHDEGDPLCQLPVKINQDKASPFAALAGLKMR